MFKKLIAASCLLITSATALAADPSVIYLTRHAEKLDNSSDPGLTQLGKVRAQNIATTLSRANVATIYSTEFNRTWQTAKPLSDMTNVPVTAYNPFELAAFAETLKAMTGNALVVGHSNTTPDLVTMLGGNAGDPISEDEYDRLYQVIRGDNDQVTTILLTTFATVDNSACKDAVLSISNLAGTAGQWSMHDFELDGCLASLRVQINGGEGDADIYVRMGAAPTDSEYDCRPYRTGNFERCKFAGPQAGKWYVGIKGFTNYSGVTLSAQGEH